MLRVLGDLRIARHILLKYLLGAVDLVAGDGDDLRHDGLRPRLLQNA